MNNETFTETKYAIRHKPTQKQVQFENEEIVPSVKLVDFKDCLINSSQGFLIQFLKRSAFNGTPNYGNDNFLEFEFVKIKTTHTIEE